MYLLIIITLASKCGAASCLLSLSFIFLFSSYVLHKFSWFILPAYTHTQTKKK